MIEGTCKQCGKTIMKNSKQQQFCPECKRIRDKASTHKYYQAHAEELLMKKRYRSSDKLVTPYTLTPERAKHQADTTVWCRDYAEKQKAKTLAMIGRVGR